jgi:hypothetical protein
MKKKSDVASTFTLVYSQITRIPFDPRAGYERSKFMDDPKWQVFAKTKVKVYCGRLPKMEVIVLVALRRPCGVLAE